MKIIHILGASGSGTSTLGTIIASNLGYHHMDTDNYFWEPSDPPFTIKRNEEERINLIINEFKSYEKIVLTGSLCGWGDSLIPYFSTVIELLVPADIRYKRIQLRELKRFGSRIMKGGDMYKKHHDFLEWAMNFDDFGPEHRSRIMHDLWLKKVKCPVLQIDGTKPLTDIYNQIKGYL